MRRAVALVLVGGLALGGCASYTPSSAPVPRMAGLPVWRADRGVTVGADPYVALERQEAVFGGNLAKEGVLPIQLLVENASGRRFVLRKSDVLLELDGGRQIAPTGASSVAATKEDSAGVIGWTIAFGIIGALAASSAEESARAARLEDYRQKELRDATLDPGSSVYSFVYFRPPRGTPPFDRATLTVRLFEPASLETAVFRLPLDRLGFEGKADEAVAGGPPMPPTEPVGTPKPPVTTAAVAPAPTPQPHLGVWKGTLTLTLPVAGSSYERPQQPVTLRIAPDGSRLRWHLEGEGAAEALRAAGWGSAVDDQLTLSGTFDEGAARFGVAVPAAGTQVSFTLLRRGTVLEGSGLTPDNQVLTLSLTRAR